MAGPVDLPHHPRKAPQEANIQILEDVKGATVKVRKEEVRIPLIVNQIPTIVYYVGMV